MSRVKWEAVRVTNDMQPIIKVENLSKRYQLGGPTSSYSTVRETIMDAARGMFRRNTNGSERTLWALKDVSFEVKPGEVIGVIGRNGAGKSTLLKVLSRITEPTKGKVELYGRVASLLEVGTGFHPELSGRENVYLNGSILGMRKTEIERKFDEIVDFAEIEKFIDTPVKRYSSGMYVRLAFAVAAHLEPEILVVDEVLAVGDYAFQQKCLNAMKDITTHGRTVLFVSHNLGAINRLCQTCILLDQGQIIDSGVTSSVVTTYMSSALSQRAQYEQPPAPDKDITLRRMSLIDEDGAVRSEFGYDESVRVSIEYDVNRPVTNTSIGIGFFSMQGTCAFQTADFDSSPELLGVRAPGKYKTEVVIPGQWFNTGRYSINVDIASRTARIVYDSVEPLAFAVIDTGTPASRNGVVRRGVLQPMLHWTTSQDGSVG